MLTSKDGVDFQPLVPQLLGQGRSSEATLRFDKDNTLFCLQRRDGGAPNDSTYLGVSRSPYTEWKWHDLKVGIGGPNLFQLPSGQWIAAGRGRIAGQDGAKTVLSAIDLDQETMTPIIALPSGGDCSYPGVVWHDDVLYVSYYSSHEEKRTSIYLAQVRMK